ncbi:MAG: RNA methyltransferase [Ruminococcaceae bacterium]|nr:RNA methyltransferase [Oscillospiraceae bacterium]
MKIETFLSRFGGEFISSRSNGTVSLYAKLADKKHRDENRLFLSEGIKLAEEALLHSHVEAVVFSEGAVKGESERVLALAENAKRQGVRIIAAGGPAFDKLSSEKSPQGVIAVSRYMERHDNTDADFSAWQKGKRILILDRVRDPGNLGTIIRSAAAMGFDGIVAVECADIYNTKTLRASMGALFRCDIFQTSEPVSLIEKLKVSDRRVLAASLGTVSYTLGETELLENDCIVIGNEGHGIEESVLAACSAALKIPMTEGSESLNAAAAAAVIMWEYHKTFR